MRTPSIQCFYTENMVPKELTGSYSWSPSKPKFLLEYFDKLGLSELLEIKADFLPFSTDDFLVAHNEEYVTKFFNGVKPLCESNSIPWNQDFAQTLRYTNASLYNAIKTSIVNPEQVTFSPTSGFHHATPGSGVGFCTFSGQVIASVKLYNEFGVKGAYLDLDGHFGNSIEDSRGFVPELNQAIPYGMNINPLGMHRGYVQHLENRLTQLRESILEGKIDYVVWCHGADSHSDDDLGKGQCYTDEWIRCSQIFFEWVKNLDEERGKPLPVTISLFGGYRPDHYESVLELHVGDITTCSSILLGNGEAHYPNVKDPFGYDEHFHLDPRDA